ncbi:MAG: tungstate transporter permease [Chloroflexi bacterium RBG_13_68_17]|nr:MAG: tungstate transporter permease [Chloroflexi bacterium RBG_13_68_17]
MDTFVEALLGAVRLLLAGDPALWDVIGMTVGVSGSALAISTLLGVPAGAGLGLTRFPGKRLATALVYTGMGLPPVVVGLAVYLLLSRAGPMGGLAWLFTPAAMVLAQTVIAFPLVAGLTKAAIESVDPDLRLQVRSLGASSWQEMGAMLEEASLGVVASILAGLGGILSEVGAAMLVGGNIEGQTRVLSTAIVLETRRGDFGLALALGGILLATTFLLNVLGLRLAGRHG